MNNNRRLVKRTVFNSPREVVEQNVSKEVLEQEGKVRAFI